MTDYTDQAIAYRAELHAAAIETARELAQGLILKAAAAALEALLTENAELKSSLGAARDAANIYRVGMEASNAEVARLQAEIKALKAASFGAGKRDIPIMALDDGPAEGIGWTQPNPLPRGMRS